MQLCTAAAAAAAAYSSVLLLFVWQMLVLPGFGWRKALKAEACVLAVRLCNVVPCHVK
jgi:hypothetical protein